MLCMIAFSNKFAFLNVDITVFHVSQFEDHNSIESAIIVKYITKLYEFTSCAPAHVFMLELWNVTTSTWIITISQLLTDSPPYNIWEGGRFDSHVTVQWWSGTFECHQEPFCYLIVIMSKHFVKNKHFLLLNKNYAFYENQSIGNKFGIFCHIIITQFHNLTIWFQ